MDANEIKQLQQAVGKASWKMDLWAFANAMGQNADHDYVRDKFKEFQALSKALNGFDSATLAKIVNAVEG
jgi:hypothetical protein